MKRPVVIKGHVCRHPAPVAVVVFAVRQNHLIHNNHIQATGIPAQLQSSVWKILVIWVHMLLHDIKNCFLVLGFVCTHIPLLPPQLPIVLLSYDLNGLLLIQRRNPSILHRIIPLQPLQLIAIPLHANARRNCCAARWCHAAAQSPHPRLSHIFTKSSTSAVGCTGEVPFSVDTGSFLPLFPAAAFLPPRAFFALLSTATVVLSAFFVLLLRAIFLRDVNCECA
mmetsp:Transcript_20919/g.35978  ORF Transcript_20919/g.35978 Transcript_20919/m.35978 type:complete len:224 (-) Transcript_20919:2492-3163(-)